VSNDWPSISSFPAAAARYAATSSSAIGCVRVETHRGQIIPGSRSTSATIVSKAALPGPTTIAELHRGLAHKRSTLTSILDRLVARGFVTRRVGTTDRRTFVVAPTTRGRKVARAVLRHLADLERAVKARVTADDLRAFLKVIAAVEDEAHRRAT